MLLTAPSAGASGFLAGIGAMRRRVRRVTGEAAHARWLAVHDALTANAGLLSVLGGPKIYDEPPRGAAFPYVTLGETRINDVSAGGEPIKELIG